MSLKDLEKLIDQFPLTAQLKSVIISEMLLGKMDWNTGCWIRDKLDTLSDQELEELCEELQSESGSDPS